MLPSRLVIVMLGLLLLAPMLPWATMARAQEEAPEALAAVAGPAHLGGDLPGDPQIQLIEVVSGMANPVNLAFPHDDSGRMFVVTVDGFLRIVDAEGKLLPEPFLDLSGTVALRPGQQGLLGLAFHPNYAENGLFYVAFNNLFANGALSLSEFQVSQDDPNVADPRTERPLLVIDKPYPQHNGGTLRFGPDGYLYMATGDGGWQGDPFDNAQSRFSLLGKILRIDVDGRTDGHPYGIPADNPFAGPGRYDSPYPGQPPAAVLAGDAEEELSAREQRRRERELLNPVAPDNRRLRAPVRQEIWALGFRNPWQFSFDPATGDFYVGDVGTENWEEIDFQPAGTPAGQNYGWDWLEASHCYPPEIGESCPRQQVGVLPIAEYAHGDDGCAVIGLGVYRGEAAPALDGIYFSGEYCTGEIRGLQRDEHGVWQFQNLLDTALQITGSGQDANGDLYVTAVTTRRGSGPDGPPNGSVWKLVGANQVPEGATTVPLGTMSGGDIEVDEEGNPLDASEDEAADEPPAAPDQDVADEAAEQAATPAAATGAAETKAVIEMLDIYFEPERVRIPANTDVRLVFPNNGQTVHNFALHEKGVGVDISIDVEPGMIGETIVNLPAGNYKFVCDIPGHKQAGMTGVLAVS